MKMGYRDQRKCEWSGPEGKCSNHRWAPYSWRYCPYHFAVNAIEKGQRFWARERFCGVLNGFTSHLGDVKWNTNWPRHELVEIATELLKLRLDPLREVQLRQAMAAHAERYPHKWERYDRTVPMDYEGTGSRVVAKTNRDGNGFTEDLENYGP